MATLRKQASDMGHPVVGALKRVKDDVFKDHGAEVVFRQYVDAEGTLYAVSVLGRLEYIAGEDFVI